MFTLPAQNFLYKYHCVKRSIYYLISWMGDFVERYGFRIVSGESPKTMQKLCLSKKFSHQEIRWNYGILRKVFYHMKDHEALFAFWQKISFWDSPVFMLSTLKATTIKIYFLHYEIGIKTLCTTSYLTFH